MIALIAAVARNGVIGADGRIPWDIPEDRAHFKELTMGHVLVMGRRTYEEIGRPLPGRITIVVSKKLTAEGARPEALKLHDALFTDRHMDVPQALKAHEALSADAPEALKAGTGLLFAASLEEALCLAADVAPEKAVFIAGGGQLYAAAIESADVLYLTEIDAEIAGDVFFPLAYVKQKGLFESEVTGEGEAARDDASGNSALSYRYVTYRRLRS